MDHALVVRVRHAAAQPLEDHDCALFAERLTLQECVQRFAFDAFHDQVWAMVVVAGVEDRDHVGVVEAGDRAALLLEALEALDARER